MSTEGKRIEITDTRLFRMAHACIAKSDARTYFK